MMKKIFHTRLLLLSLVGAVFVLSGCSKDDDGRQESQEQKAANPLTEAVGTLNQNMADLNFNDLQPLATTLETATTRGGSEDNEALADFQEKLKSLIQLLRGGFNMSVPYGCRFSYQSFNDVLDLAWDISGNLEVSREDDTYIFGKHTYGKGEASYTAADGSVYQIAAETEKGITIKDWSINVTGARQLYVYKNGEQVLSIVSESERNRPVWLPLLIKGNSMTGEVIYKDYDIRLSYNKESTHVRTVELGYKKVGSEKQLIVMTTTLTDDADIISIITHDVTVSADFTVKALDGTLTLQGNTENVNYLVLNGIDLAKYMEEGTTEEQCNSLVTQFNNNVKLTMFLGETSMGDIFLATRQDAAGGVYKPSLMLRSALLENQEIDLNAVLESLGVSVQDLLKSASQLN